MTLDNPWKRARFHGFFLALIAAVLTGSLVFPEHALAAPTASPAAGSAEAGTFAVAQLTQDVYEQTNQLRFAQGLPGYARDSRLDKVAMAWALQQWTNGAMSHNPYYAQQIPAGWTRAGENVASGYTSTQVVAAWVASPTHYANLVRDYTSIGIGYYESDGRRYWVQTFATYPGTAVPRKPTPARRLFARVAVPAPVGVAWR